MRLYNGKTNFPKSIVQNYTVSVEYMVSAQLSWLGYINQRCTIGEDVRIKTTVSIARSAMQNVLWAIPCIPSKSMKVSLKEN